MKKLISCLIAAMMVFTMIPGIAFADSETDRISNEKTMFYMDLPDPLGDENIEDMEVIEITPFSVRDEAALISDDIDYATTIEGAGSVLREGMVNRQEEIAVGYRMDEWTDEAFKNAVNSILNEAEKHTGAPAEGDSLRWVKGAGSMSGSAWSDGTYYYTTIVYSLTYYTTAEQEKELDAAVDALLSEIITDDMTDYAKVKAIYDYMTANIAYDYDHYGDNSYKLQFTAYAALTNKTSVCQGYSALFYRLALECGVDARMISGEATNSNGQKEGHGWNIVKLGGKYYLADATWDTSRVSVGVPYDYFLKASYDDHFADDEYKTAEFAAVYPMAAEDYVACTEHTPEVIPAVEPTCKTTGWTEGSKCSICGEILAAQEFIPEKGHTFSGAWWSNSFTHWKVCSCGAKGEEAEHTLVTTTVEPTCEEMGMTIETCTVCGNESTTSIPELDHDRVYHEGKAVTCTESGWDAYDTCTRCDYTTYREIPATGHAYVWVIDQYATEEQFGIKHEECTKCGGKQNENTVIPKLDHTHDMVKVFAVEATCTKDGNIECYTCSKCGKYYSDKEGQLQITEADVVIKAEGHIYSDWVVQNEATCTKEGLKYKACKCGSTIIEDIPALGHDVFVHDAKAATCTAVGWDEYETCSRCDYTTYREIAAKGHNFVWVVETPATDTADGIKHEECTGCGEKRSENTVIPKLDCVHNMVKTEGTAATCTKAGVAEHYTCTKCDKVYADKEGQLEITATVIPALGHDIFVHDAKAVTCTAAGWDEYETCSRCDYTTYKEIPATGHKETVDSGQDPDCEGYGYTDGLYCSVCDAILVMPEVIEPLGHTPEKLAAIEPTCTTEGYTEAYQCTRCHKFMEPRKTIPALGHTPVIIPAKPGNCSNGGSTEGLKCSVCNKVLEEPKYSDTPVHTFSKTYKVVTPATMQKEGLKAIVCTKCGAVSEKSIEIPQIKSATVTALVYNGYVRNPVPNIVNYYKNTKLKKGTDYTVVYKNGAGTKVVKPKNVGKYTAVITFKGQYKGTIKRTFNINPKATVINKLTKPAKKQIKVTWQKRTAQVTGYEIQYSTTKNFTKKTTKTLKVKNFKTNTKTIKNLKAKKKYWVKVRTYKNVNGKLYYSAWSKVKYITTK